MEFNDHFKLVHQTIGSGYTIEQLASIVDPTRLGYRSKNELYAPVALAIQVNDKTAIRLNVPVHSDENWYNNVRERLAQSMAKPELAKKIELTTVTGKPVTMVDSKVLANVGTLKMIINGEPSNVDSSIAVPLEYSFAKRENLARWVEKTAKSLPDAIAKELFKKDAAGVDAAIKRDGTVHKIIQEHMRKNAQNGDWNQHVRVHHVNPGVSDPASVMNAVSKTVLSQVRAYIGASSERLKQYIANVVQTAEVASAVDAPILGQRSATTTVAGKSEDGHALYKKLVEDTMASQQLAEYMINSLHTATSHVAVNKKVDSNRPAKMVVSKIEPHNPLFAQIHHTLLPIRGTYPSHYLARHNDVDMKASAAYPGNLDDTYKAYHLLSNRHTAPPGLILNAGKPMRNMPTAAAAAVAGKSDVKSVMRSRLVSTTLADIIPGLIPLGSGILVGSDVKSVMRSRLVPTNAEVAPPLILLETGVPDLIPFIGCGHDSDASDSDSESGTIKAVMRDRLQPIADHDDADDEFAGLPTVDDVWK